MWIIRLYRVAKAKSISELTRMENRELRIVKPGKQKIVN